MEIIGQAGLDIVPQLSSDFGRRLDRDTSGALIAAGSAGGRHYGDSAGRSMVSSFTSHARRAATVGAGILAAGVAAAGFAAWNFGQSALDEAEEAQKVGALTAQVIKTTGAAANVTAREVGDLSEALSNKTGVDDEVIQRGANMLLTFKNIRNEVGAGNDIFSQSVAITEDMAAAMAGGQGGNGFDLKSSSILVGKALNDPVKGLTALTRVGVSFTDQQRKNIESLVEQNKQSEAQKIILGELQSEFGGAAQAQATLGEKVDVAWGNIQERIGNVLLPMVRDVQRAFLREGVPALERFSDWFRSDGAPAIRDFVGDARPKIAGFIDDVRPLAEEALPAVASVLGDVRDILGDAAPYAADLVGAFNDMPDWAKKGLALGGVSALAAGKFGLFSRGGPGGGVLGAFTKSAPLPVIVVNDLPGFDDDDAAGIFKRSPWAATLGLAAVPAVTGAAAATVTPSEDRISAATANSVPGSSFAVPPGTRPDDLANVFSWDSLKKDLPTWLGGTAGADEADQWLNATDSKIDSMTKSLIAGVGGYRAELKGVPQELVTKFTTPGLVDSRRDAVQLMRQYDLTPKQKDTLFRLLGGKAVKNETNDILGLYRQANQTYTGDVRVNTGDTESRLLRILNLANSINRLGALSVATGGSDLPQPSPRTKTGGGTRKRGTTINVHLDGKKVGEVFDERIGTWDDLADERRRAGGRP